MNFKVYIGASGEPDLEMANEAAPQFTYGFCWTPEKMTNADYPYILDNGAYKAFARNEVWDVDGFVNRLNQIKDMPRQPDFVVLPDVVADSQSTYERSKIWAEIINAPTALAIQDGMTPNKVEKVANDLGVVALFIGGSKKWKRNNAEDFVEIAKQNGFIAHIARPGDLVWAKRIGADSVDTSTIARGREWHKLEKLRDQQGLTDF